MGAATSSNQKTVEDSQDKIRIEGLNIPAEIGVLDSEKGRTQSLRFDVEIQTVPGYRDIVAKTGSYVSYADTVFFIKEKAATGGHIDLVEEWAEAVASFVLENPLAEQVIVKVTKPDIFEDAAGVGIQIARRRS
ncbi:dihydroneopterin aldolase [Labrenzia sp. PHM005]|uniref:dihydroneopterin aldolase n=1 Tax=Labrenzia sp. PHM005 TaxID=2590016 RepID=UPI0011407040|nr:dihydroneopterin aldolase [Labrenzia sp. PHM005]QDG74901.1 dihydroneopterin aldolase [Labrenzia sp. PHM005]